MRILHVTDFYLPRHGGVERVIQGIAREQLCRDHRPEVLTRRLEAGAAALESLDGMPVHRVGPAPGRAPRYYLELRRAAAEWARRELGRFDLVHAHLTLTSLGPVAEAARRGLGVVASFYGPWHREFLLEVGPGGLQPRGPAGLATLGRWGMASFMRWAQTRLLDAAGRVIVLSAHSARELEEFGYNGRSRFCRAVPGGVDPEKFHPGARSALAERRLSRGDGPVILAVRRLVPRMGLGLLLDAFSRLRLQWPGSALLVAGEGPLRGEIERRAAALEGVQVLGRVEEPDLPGLYARADLVVMPTVALEGFGLPVLEAWASGTPVVGMPVGSLPELLGRADARFVARQPTLAGLTHVMGWAVEAGKAWCSERLRQLALSYRWSSIADRTQSVYQEALAGSGP